MKQKTEIFSIFGQIEGVIADAMAKEGVYRIEPDMIPATARYNEVGQIAHCAMVMTPAQRRAFDRRVKDLRA